MSIVNETVLGSYDVVKRVDIVVCVLLTKIGKKTKGHKETSGAMHLSLALVTATASRGSVGAKCGPCFHRQSSAPTGLLIAVPCPQP